MQAVSRQYKESMRGHARNRGYIRATIGVYNTKAQENLVLDTEKTNTMYISDLTAPFEDRLPERIYATPENNFSKVDGSMFFAPHKESGYSLYNNGIVTDDALGSVYIYLKEGSYGIKGITIDFGDCYPTDFTIETDEGTKSYEGNDKRYFTTEDTFNRTTFFIIRPYKMVNEIGRLRIYKFSCGVTNSFTNKDVKNYSGKEYVSPIAETVPSNDVSLTVFNYDLYYSPDNPNSALAYMEIGQEVKIAFGYDVDGNGNIEWLPEKKSYLKTWKANESQAEFTATDIFDNISGTYYRGKFYKDGISLYDLAVDVFEDAGIVDYFIDTYLKSVIIYNPMPTVSYSSALQIIANAGRCVLREDRRGRVHLQSSFIPEMIPSTNNQAKYSHIENVLKNDVKDGYATASNDFSIVDGSLRFVPKDDKYLNIGYVSESIWIETKEDVVKNRLSFRLGNPIKKFPLGGYWDGDMPIITIDLEATYTAFGLFINFRNTAPQKMVIKTYSQEYLADYVVVENPDIHYQTDKVFVEFDKMEIIFEKGYPNSRVFVDNIIIGDATDYELTRKNELITAPIASRNKKVKEISVSYSNYKETSDLKEIVSEELTVSENDYEHYVYFNVPYYGIEVKVDSNNVTAEILEESSYYAKIKFSGISSETTFRYYISGYEYTKEELKYTSVYSQNGEVKTWNNPLVSSLEHAKELEKWLSSYFLGDVEYEIEWKGDPAVDANDLFHLETRFGTSFIRDYENTLTFNGRWKGKIKARKVAK